MQPWCCICKSNAVVVFGDLDRCDELGNKMCAEGSRTVPELSWKQVLWLWNKSGALVDLRQQVHLEVGGKGVRQAHVAGEG